MKWELLCRCNSPCTRLQRWWVRYVCYWLSTNARNRWEEQNVMRISVTDEFPLDPLDDYKISLFDFIDALEWLCWHLIVHCNCLKVHLLVSWIFLTLTGCCFCELDLLKLIIIFNYWTGTTLYVTFNNFDTN